MQERYPAKRTAREELKGPLVEGGDVVGRPNSTGFPDSGIKINQYSWDLDFSDLAVSDFFAAVSTASCAGLKIVILETEHMCDPECVVNFHAVRVVRFLSL